MSFITIIHSCHLLVNCRLLFNNKHRNLSKRKIALVQYFTPVVQSSSPAHVVNGLMYAYCICMLPYNGIFNRKTKHVRYIHACVSPSNSSVGSSSPSNYMHKPWQGPLSSCYAFIIINCFSVQQNS